MSATNCLTVDMLKVGMTHEATLTFTREEVERYCELADDRNAIHHELEAAQVRFPGVHDIVVPGGLVQIAITGLFGTQFPGDGSLGLTFSPERFRKPVCPGDQVLIRIEVTRIRGALVEVEVAIDDADGGRISAATSRILAPDADYRRWWEAQRNA